MEDTMKTPAHSVMSLCAMAFACLTAPAWEPIAWQRPFPAQAMAVPGGGHAAEEPAKLLALDR